MEIKSFGSWVTNVLSMDQSDVPELTGSAPITAPTWHWEITPSAAYSVLCCSARCHSCGTVV